MKKKIPIILFCVTLVLISINRCSNSEIGKKSDIQISQKDVSLTIKDGTLTNKSATLIVKNNSDRKVRYGDSYDLEIKRYGKWHKVNTTIEHWSLLYAVVLDVGESREIELSWEGTYGIRKRKIRRI